MSNAELLSVQDLSIYHGDVPIVKTANFAIKAGEVVAMMGVSGAGKSSIAKALLGISKLKASGKVQFDGQSLPIDNQHHDAWQSVRGRGIAYVFQEPKSAMNPTHSVERAFSVLWHHLNQPKSTHRQATIDALAQVGIGAPERLLRRYPHELSGGEAQRIALAQVLIFQPKLIIADEPTSQLNQALADEVMTLLIAITKQTRSGLLIISHDKPRMMQLTDKVLLLSDGHCQYVDKQTLEPTLKPSQIKPLQHTDANQAILSIDNLRIFIKKSWFGCAPLFDTPINLTLHQGTITGLVGASGKGKTSIAKGMLRLDSRIIAQGSVRFGNAELLTMPQKQLNATLPSIVYLDQDIDGSLNPYLTVYESITEGLLANKTPIDDVDIHTLCAQLNLSPDILPRHPHTLSGGEKQRVSIMRALLVKPQILILDEPTSMLDESATNQLLQLLSNLATHHRLSILLISHDVDVIHAVCHHVLSLD